LTSEKMVRTNHEAAPKPTVPVMSASEREAMDV
jgi:hypothetical protein